MKPDRWFGLKFPNKATSGGEVFASNLADLAQALCRFGILLCHALLAIFAVLFMGILAHYLSYVFLGQGEATRA